MAYVAAQDYLTRRQVKAQDHLVISALWNTIGQLLTAPTEEADTFIRQLADLLPPVACVPAHDLPGIARIHLQSSIHLKATMRLLVPEAFEGSDTTDATSLAGFADRLPPSAEPMVLRLIDLQIFHLNRAQKVAAQMRLHAQARRERLQNGTAADADADAGTFEHTPGSSSPPSITDSEEAA